MPLKIGLQFSTDLLLAAVVDTVSVTVEFFDEVDATLVVKEVSSVFAKVSVVMFSFVVSALASETVNTFVVGD